MRRWRQFRFFFGECGKIAEHFLVVVLFLLVGTTKKEALYIALNLYLWKIVVFNFILPFCFVFSCSVDIHFPLHNRSRKTKNKNCQNEIVIYCKPTEFTRLFNALFQRNWTSFWYFLFSFFQRKVSVYSRHFIHKFIVKCFALWSKWKMDFYTICRVHKTQRVI